MAILTERVAGFSSTLGIQTPTIHRSPDAEDPVLAVALRQAYGHRFVAFTVRVGSRHRLYVDPATVELLSPSALSALAAHECGHAADWVAGLSERLGALVLPEGWHMALEGRAGPMREAFADRVACALAGEDALRILHDEAGAALGMPRPQGPPPVHRPGLPPSLRSRLLRA